MSEDYEEEVGGQITSLVPQLGTSPKIMGREEWDMRLLSYIINPENVPSSYRPILYALVRRDVVIKRKRFWDALVDNHLVLLNSIQGRGRNDQIRGENAIKGIPVQMEKPVEKPGLTDHLFNRDKVKEYEAYKEAQEMGIT